MDIEQLNKHILNIINKYELTTSTFYILAKLKTNSDKVEYMYDFLKACNVLPDIIEVKKESATSEKYRNLGNGFYAKKVYKRALFNYNKAVMFAPNDSKELSLALANRSAVLFYYKLYSACIDDVNKAMAAGYDEFLKDKILKRKSMCEEAISKGNEENEIELYCRRQFKISKERNPMIPCASKSIEVSYSENMERSVIATEYIAPGEVVAFEKPYCCVLIELFFSDYCYGCLEQSFSKVPCKHCCFVMFCNNECRDKAWKLFHSIECQLMPLLSAMKFDKRELLALRNVIQTKCTLSEWDILQHTIQESESVKDPTMKGFTKDNSCDNLNAMIFDSENYNPIHTLVSNVENRNISDIFAKSVTAAIFLHCLLKYSSFFSEDENCSLSKEKCVKLIGGLLLHHNMIVDCNMQTICALVGTNLTDLGKSVHYGGGTYAFLSLVNHSCAPNVVSYCLGSSKALVALRPIKKGQQLFDNYGYHHASTNLRDRQICLEFRYKFKCECEACLNDWPLYDNLRRVHIVGQGKKKFLMQQILSIELVDELKKGNRKKASEILNRLYPYVCMLDESAPSLNLVHCHEIIKHCWSLFGNVGQLN